MRRISLAAAGAILLCAAAVSGAAARATAFFFVDLRYQEISGGGLRIFPLIAVFAASLLLFGGEYRLMPEKSAALLLKLNLPLLCWIPFWFVPPRFAELPVLIAAGAWAAARVAAHWQEPRREPSRAAWIVAAVALGFGLAGGALQSWSYAKMALSWYDWGHFYEVLVNTLNGRFFYLNLENGSYLGSRFCPTLLLMLPVAALKSPPLFLTCGALLVASGAVIFYAGARALKLPPRTAMPVALGYLLLPVTINQFLVLLDGFHEVYLLVPLVFGAWAAYRAGRLRWAALLVLLSFGVRESIGFMWAGWGIVLWLQGKRKTGALLFGFAAVATAFLLFYLMPRMGYGRYVHTTYFSHLGNTIGEIALSPFVRPAAFWRTLFSGHNLIYWMTLLVPFAYPAYFAKRCWIPMLPDLLMISLDGRFDSQNLLRHYQIVPLMVLSIAAAEGIAALDFQERKRRGAVVYLLTAAVLSSAVLTQIPGLPASDPRLPEWSYASPVLDKMISLLPENASVTAGPRIASHLAGKYDLHLLRGDVKRDRIADFVAVESFIPTYGENTLRMSLLTTPGWKLIFSEYLDERLIQLFKREKDAPPTVAAMPPSMSMADEKSWANWGSPVPCALQEISLRALPVPGGLLIGARIMRKMKFDFGLDATLHLENEISPLKFFSSCGDGKFPASCAGEGTVWLMQIPVRGRITRCRVDAVVLP